MTEKSLVFFQIQSGTMHIDRWNAEVTATVKIDLGEIHFWALTHSTQMVDVIDVTSTEKKPDGKPAPWKGDFLPGNPISARRIIKPTETDAAHYPLNPPRKSRA